MRANAPKPDQYRQIIHPVVDHNTGELIFADRRHPLARINGMVSVGRHVLSVKLGRWLEPDEIVHYEDGNPQNVDPDNLSLSSRAELASQVHNHQVEMKCLQCGASFWVSPSHQTRRKCCSDDCQQLYARKIKVSSDELERLVQQDSMVQVGKILGVSDKTVAKWCSFYGIVMPSRRKKKQAAT